MFAARKAAMRLLPFLVVVWATFAVLGGALYLAKHSGPPQDSLAEAGMGLCAATVALLVGVRARRLRGDRFDLPYRKAPGFFAPRPAFPPIRILPLSLVPLTRLLQVFRI